MNTSLTPEIQSQLNLLKDINLPDTTPWWALAPGWWGLIVATVMIAFGLGVYQLIKRRSMKTLALKELTILKQQDLTVQDLAAQISVLLHRFAISRHGKRVGQLSGAAWRDFLVKGKSGMASDVASYLIEAPYRPAANSSLEPAYLVASTERWIRRHS